MLLSVYLTFVSSWLGLDSDLFRDSTRAYKYLYMRILKHLCMHVCPHTHMSRIMFLQMWKFEFKERRGRGRRCAPASQTRMTIRIFLRCVLFQCGTHRQDACRMWGAFAWDYIANGGYDLSTWTKTLLFWGTGCSGGYTIVGNKFQKVSWDTSSDTWMWKIDIPITHTNLKVNFWLPRNLCEHKSNKYNWGTTFDNCFEYGFQQF